MGAITSMKISRGQSVDTSFPPLANYVDARVLAASVAETITVPTGANFVRLAGTTAFFYRADGSAATVPAGDVTDGTASALVATEVSRAVRGVATISVIASGTPTVTAEFWG